MTNNSRKRYLLKNIFIFSLGNLGTKLISFFLVPLYTYLLTTAEYGTIDLINVISTVIVPLLTLNISEAVMRFSMDNDSNRQSILNIGIVILIFDCVLSVLLFPVLIKTNGVSDYAFLFILYILSFASSSIFLCYIRGSEKLLDYSIINIIQTFFIALFNILFLIKFKMGIRGYILAYILSYLISTILCIIRGKIKFTYETGIINKKLFKEMSKYSILLIPNSLMWWIMNSLDKVMVSKLISLDANGIYSVSYKIPSILITLTAIFNQAWMFSAIKEKNSKDKNEYTNNIFKALTIFVVLTATFLLLIIKPLLMIYVGKDFYTAWMYVAPLLIGTIFMTVSTFLSNEYTAHKDSKGFLYSSSIGAGINFILNFILIPYWGIYGAAIATCISYIAVFVFRAFNTRKYVKINYFSRDIILSLIIILLISILIYFNYIYIYVIMLSLLLLLLFINREFLLKIIKLFLQTITSKFNTKDCL